MKKTWFLGALWVSVGAHVFAAGWMPAAPAPVLDGGVVAGEVALGLGFEDLVAGSVHPVVPMETPPVSAVQTPETPPTDMPIPTEAPVPPKALVPDSPQVTAQAPQERIVAHTPPPKPTPPEVKKPPKPATQPPSQSGNADTNAKKGAVTTTPGDAAQRSQKTAKPTASNAGDGAVRSYQSQILRKIARVPKRSAGARGKAMVGLTITASGAISNVAIVQSSGHAGIDKIALAQVQRAGPFTPTPTGKPIKLVVRFESKG
ncbi:MULTISPECIES: TonB family protein [Roseobacteraceae]|uniref:TonB family protein n=1 Tax=Celeribacter baekdonensis B30 TaxID=1208323 RepID=K2JFZ2_9RHOB|nr:MULTISPECIES: TonB family protein [Roseobacteraceae]EKE73507.1 TonB family protein [Celeribacter baekdonensis B30]KAB6717571.1 energy transducer TonB [Roseobacter sp. TSBP12]|tara:strand:+ start:883 stop:1662 length:780 start_codon:yes stop_codon:yes gene_type:complete